MRRGFVGRCIDWASDALNVLRYVKVECATPPSVLPDISPSRGEINMRPAFDHLNGQG
ncbi:protein of unknown function [Agrobacterium pusense]|uniref:Uncharacterized protein n=1 Tax=Agrobacterium pusense TaxID=648995 RepID=U4PVE9_9HYPH|nr:protein of unknown function [Agrobacterium pusense]